MKYIPVEACAEVLPKAEVMLKVLQESRFQL